MTLPFVSHAMPLWLQIAIIGAWLGLVGGLAEWLHRTQRASSEVVRKIVHIGVGNVILLAWWLQVPLVLGVVASVLFSGVTLLAQYVPILPSISSVGRKSFGTVFYALSFGILIAWFWSIQRYHCAALGVLVMTWGDGLAAIVGQRFGSHVYKLWGMSKSWEGSLTMGLVSYGVSSAIMVSVYGNSGGSWLTAFIIAIAATLLEAFSKFGIDNLTVPLGSASLCYLLGQVL